MYRLCVALLSVMALPIFFCCPALESSALAQGSRGARPLSEVFQQVAARAKETGQPLVVFGMSETCVRCQALKQGLTTNPELKLLMTQYVSTEVPFGGNDFRELFSEAVRQNPELPRSIGAPAVFIYTAKGETVYAGPNRESGMAADGEFKSLLISGIDKNGGLQVGSAQKPAPALAADLAKARRLLADNQLVAASSIVAKQIQPSDGTSEEAEALMKLTGLDLARPKAQAQLDRLVEEIAEKGRIRVKSAVAVAAGNATVGAVQLAELERAFGDFPGFDGVFDAAWQQVEKQASLPRLRQQAKLIDKARQAEGIGEPTKAIEIYEHVVAEYAGTQGAELCQQRIAQLKMAPPADSRTWKSKDGKFSVSAALVSFDGTTVKLRSSDGRNISVPLTTLSAADQAFLKTHQ